MYMKANNHRYVRIPLIFLSILRFILIALFLYFSNLQKKTFLRKTKTKKKNKNG